MFTAAVLTISTSGSKGERVDTSGPNLVEILKNDGYDTKYAGIVSDDKEQIKVALLKLIDEKINLVLTTGGTGFTKTDVTPEATLDVIDKETRGIPEMMRTLSYKITDKSILSRAVAGIKNDTLNINLPGSKKAAEENFLSVKNPIRHGLEMLITEGSNNCGG